jgi:hypothetical protein
MNLLERALALAKHGFHVFPCEANGKKPVINDFPNRATRDPEQIERWFRGNDYNIGISTTRFGDDHALVVIDVDNKNGKDGDAQLLSLELEGHDLPASLEQSTPSGGRHIVYITDNPLKQGTNVLGAGLDIRSRGGYIVGPGSTIDGRAYKQINGHGQLAPAPQWLIEKLGQDHRVESRAGVVLDGVDADRARDRALAYLSTAPVAVEGESGDLITFKVAARLKDLGVSEPDAFDLMLAWNQQCSPPWTADELNEKIFNAYRYGREPQGSSAPEAVFTPAVNDNEDDGVHPVDALNTEYAFIKAGAFVLQETTDAKERFTTIRLSPNDMHAWFANKTITVGEKQVPLSKLWMSRRSRREYDSVVFSPLHNVPARFYNLWRGFTVAPAASASHPALDAFLEHALHNVCNGDKALCHWLLGYFAHMIQKPWEKPLVALVFKGAKGTGKNALVERVGKLLGRHFLVADDERYLLGNFNSHLEANLFFVLDEAAWAGDKRAEGKLKGLITGSEHNIERKGAEPYQVDNLTRVAIIGNEKWLVPASQEERRFAVFNVGDGRRQDRDFFLAMRLGMEQGGYAHLLRFLMDYDISGVDVNDAPSTQGLIDQKHASLEPVQEWWLDCITSNELLGSSFTGELPPRIPTHKAHESFTAWARQRNVRSRLPDHNTFVKTLRAVAPSFEKKKARVEGGDPTYAFFNPGIEILRGDWDRWIGGTHDWTN